MQHRDPASTRQSPTGGTVCSANVTLGVPWHLGGAAGGSQRPLPRVPTPLTNFEESTCPARINQIKRTSALAHTPSQNRTQPHRRDGPSEASLDNVARPSQSKGGLGVQLAEYPWVQSPIP